MRVAVIGGTSAIAIAAARHFAASGATLWLAARDPARLQAASDVLRADGASEVFRHVTDFADFGGHDALVDDALDHLGNVDVVLIAYGTLPDQKMLDRDPHAQLSAFHLNGTSVISIAARFANVLEHQRRGTLAVVGSLAGDRGRRANYVYGSAKAAVHAWCEGVRARLERAGASLVLVKPGWVDTPMTQNLRKNSLFTSAAVAGASIHRAILRRRRTVYVPFWWRWISIVIRMLPSAVLTRLPV